MNTEAYRQGFMDKLAGSKMRMLLKLRNLGQPTFVGTEKQFPYGIGKLLVSQDAHMPRANIVSQIELLPQFRNLGLGRKLHIEAARAHPEGRLFSDITLSPDSVNVWESLLKRYPEATRKAPAGMIFNEKSELIPLATFKRRLGKHPGHGYEFTVPEKWRRGSPSIVPSELPEKLRNLADIEAEIAADEAAGRSLFGRLR